MSESDPLTDKYRDCVLKIFVDDLIEDIRVNGRLKRDSYKRAILSLKKIGLNLTHGALMQHVQRGSRILALLML